MKVKVKVAKKFPVQVHSVHINMKYMEKLCKEIFRFQCGMAVAVPTAAYMSVKKEHASYSLACSRMVSKVKEIFAINTIKTNYKTICPGILSNFQNDINRQV